MSYSWRRLVPRAPRPGAWILAACLGAGPALADGAPRNLLHVGDRLKITLFETIEVSDAATGSAAKESGSPPMVQTAYPRLDLSGEYGVEPSGAVTLPLFGPIAAAGRSTEDFRTALGEAFTRTYQRTASITISFMQRSPVYVVGAVRSPGAYPISPGMIVVQAVALAGGDLATSASNPAIETIRELDRRDAARERVKTSLVRMAALTAERDGTPLAKSVDSLRHLTGIDGLVATEQRMAALRAQNAGSARAARDATIAAITDEIELIKQRRTGYDAQIKVRGERLKMMEALFARQVVENERVADVRRDFVDMEGRRRDIEISLLQAEQRLEAARKAALQADLDRRLALERDLASAAAEAREAERAAAVLATTAAMQELASPPGRDSEAVGVVFEILRATSDGFETLSARETDLLEPGDVLRICTGKCRTGPATEKFVAK
ncbi:hypothetical protein PMNALOAF_0860 [Methylobacterium adhaesivum]|uniref:Polysaccharide biosynthesis/export family protein n=1 Tax=Methylobacterium adhaesivum TaxID=333297 RepID=A0ABT8BGL7_9HYPH|nr:polysaccharide biosynthesis/export family protein [Methylobacterium adhaesivum]MDN3590984.1 polysaccharide biosynthesis/export family protein [Methylobacterium adhaesivum]GJD29625.1 hypothetical protein PMNALOAF_0860 [Methylobacterium adhaesivum]